MNEETRLLDRITVSAAEAAQLLGVSRTTLYQYSHMRGFPAVRIGGRVLIPVEGLRAWVEAQAGTGMEAVSD